jgi:hypothetical protein
MIDAQLAQFLEEGLGIHIGTRNEHLEPNGARGLAVKVDDDGTHIVVYVAKVAAERLMGDLKSNGQAALSFARPVDERACQVKGFFVSGRPGKATEQTLVAEQFGRFLDNLALIGIPRDGATNWTKWPVVAIRLRVTAMFNQTPGANAGAPLS